MLNTTYFGGRDLELYFAETGGFKLTKQRSQTVKMPKMLNIYYGFGLNKYMRSLNSFAHLFTIFELTCFKHLI